MTREQLIQALTKNEVERFISSYKDEEPDYEEWLVGFFSKGGFFVESDEELQRQYDEYIRKET
jgi:hypothetical protein